MAAGSKTESRRPVARLFGVTQCAAGLGLLACPDAVGQAVSGAGRIPPAWLVRLLGARMLGQGLVEMILPDRRRLLTGAAVDASHAASMVGVAALAPDYRRPALISAAAAGFSAAAARALAGRSH
jgi:hypothetical protein